MEIPPSPGSSIFKQRWAELTKKEYEADPLLCGRCGGAMRIIAFIDQPEVIVKILTHLGLCRCHDFSSIDTLLISPLERVSEHTLVLNQPQRVSCQNSPHRPPPQLARRTPVGSAYL